MYTDDSDLVAVLAHTGHFKLKGAAPKSPLLVSLRVCPAQAPAESFPERSEPWRTVTAASRTAGRLHWLGAERLCVARLERSAQGLLGTDAPKSLSETLLNCSSSEDICAGE